MPPFNIWVWIEPAKDTFADVSLELLAKARQLADQQYKTEANRHNVIPVKTGIQPEKQVASGKQIKKTVLQQHQQNLVNAVLFTSHPNPNLNQLATAGADQVYLAQDPIFKHYQTLPFTAQLFETIQKHQPDIVLLGATRNGRDLAPRLACRLQTGLSADCLDLHLDEQGILLQTKPTYGSSIMAEIYCPNARPQMATIRPGVFPLPPKDQPSNKNFNIIELPISASARQASNQTSVLETRPLTKLDTGLKQAKVVVCGGRGLGDKASFAACQALAKLLNGAAGGTRPACEAGWIDYASQIGLSGETITPELLITSGISGAIQFTVGIKSAKQVIAINSDPQAPIFDQADYKIVGDARTILPALIARLGRE